MIYENTVEADFISRPNRFIADVLMPDGRIETVHVKNTGRCKELLLPGVKTVLCPGTNPLRKTKYDLIAVHKEKTGWINIDSTAPNTVVREWLESGKSPFKNIGLIKPEYVFGNSRVDFYLECSGRKILIEVKGCTLEIDGTGYFPDAPTERGVKHLNELAQAVGKGYECYLAFVIAVNGVSSVLPNRTTHPGFGDALEEAVEAGVKILYLQCCVTKNGLYIKPEQ